MKETLAGWKPSGVRNSCPGSAGIGVPPLFLSEYGDGTHALVSALRAACLPRGGAGREFFEASGVYRRMRF